MADPKDPKNELEGDALQIEEPSDDELRAAAPSAAELGEAAALDLADLEASGADEARASRAAGDDESVSALGPEELGPVGEPPEDLTLDDIEALDEDADEPMMVGPHDDPTVRTARYERWRPDDGAAFLPDAVSNPGPLPALDAEADAEEFIASATTGESVAEDARDEFVTDELGGPFVELDQDARLPQDEEEKHHSVLPSTRRARRSLAR